MSLNIDLLSLLLFTLSAHCQDVDLQAIELSSLCVRVSGSLTSAHHKIFSDDVSYSVLDQYIGLFLYTKRGQCIGLTQCRWHAFLGWQPVFLLLVLC